MNVVPIVLSITAGICLFAGSTHLLFGLSRRPHDWVHITFALASLAITGNTLAVLAIHSADSVTAYVAAFKYAFGPTALLINVGVLWFVAFYTRVRPRWFLVAMSLWFAGIIALQLMLPYGILFVEVSDLRSITMPWGEQFVVGQATPHPWRLAVDLFFVVFFAFLLYATYHQYRRGDRGRASLLALTILLFLPSVTFDSLVDTGVINSVYISEIVYLVFVVLMSFRLYGEVIQTEQELARYRQSLEALVEERTTELTTANEQLESEIAERRLAEETLQQRVDELAVLSSIAQMLATVTDLSSALERICEAIAHLFDAQVTYVILPSNKEPQLQVMVGFNRESGPIGVTPLPVSLSETTYFGQVLSQAETLTLSDVQALSIAAPMHEIVARQRIQNAMLVPLVVRGSAIGLLTIATDQADQVFTSDQSLLAETVAADVAGAIENARLTEQAQAAAVSEERARIARDLHDAVSQTIYSASLIAEALPRVWARSPAEGERNLVKLRQLVRGALAEMRTLLFELRPAALETAELSALLHYLGDALTGRTRIPVDVVVKEGGEEEAAPPPNVKLVLYRITQEAFNNIAKHSRATQATVTWHRKLERSTLTIQDNGRGFDPGSVSAARLGLSIMRERAQGVGAELAIRSKPGQGTEVRVEWRNDQGRRTKDGGRKTKDKGQGMEEEE